MRLLYKTSIAFIWLLFSCSDSAEFVTLEDNNFGSEYTIDDVFALKLDVSRIEPFSVIKILTEKNSYVAFPKYDSYVVLDSNIVEPIYGSERFLKFEKGEHYSIYFGNSLSKDTSYMIVSYLVKITPK